jgi:predicted nucleic acid-binding protein
VEYFRSGTNAGKIDFLIDENLLVTNDLVLAELIPFLKIRNQQRLSGLLMSIEKLPLSVDWCRIVDFQLKCLGKGINGVGIPDLIVAQNALQNNAEVYSLDGHFVLMKNILNLRLFEME